MNGFTTVCSLWRFGSVVYHKGYSCWCHSRSDRAYFISGLGGPSRRTGPQADFERPGVSPLRSGVTTAQSGRVVRWVEPSGRLRSRPESAAGVVVARCRSRLRGSSDGVGMSPTG